MQSLYRISAPDKVLKGTLTLTASKSESNRALVIRAITGNAFRIHNLAAAEDTQTMLRLLDADSNMLDVGPAGTTMRFLTAWLSCRQACNKNEPVVVTGSQRMKERPIRLLVDALVKLGARITYEGETGYPPLEISPAELRGGELVLDGSISSQYTTALLLIAPLLPGGLTIVFEGKVISRPYLNMTLNMLRYFGVDACWSDNSIRIEQGKYKPCDFTVEADWSAASYWYAMAALAKETDIVIKGLKRESLQGDAVVADIFGKLGVHTEYTEDGIRLTHSGEVVRGFSYDFTDCPDLAQTVAVVVSAMNLPARLSGLETLRIKETDRINALRVELGKFNVKTEEKEDELIILPGQFKAGEKAVVSTYEDHRMAMAFAPLAFIQPVTIADPEVVGKSYPAFWEDLKAFGLQVD